MKLYYVCTKEATKELQTPWHGVDLDNGMWLIAVSWRDDLQEDRFSKTEGVLSLPHPIFNASDRIEKGHMQHLSEKFGVHDGHTIHDLIREASKVSPVFKLKVL